MNSMFLEFLGAGNVPKALVWATEKLSALAVKIKIPELVLFAVGALIALLIGVLGYKCVKFLSAACFGIGGFAIGYALVAVAKAKFEWKIPDFVGIIIGVVLLAVLAVSVSVLVRKAIHSMAVVLLATLVPFVLGYFGFDFAKFLDFT